MWSTQGYPGLSVPHPASSPEQGANSTVSYLQSSMGHVQHSFITPQALNEITKFI